MLSNVILNKVKMDFGWLMGYMNELHLLYDEWKAAIHITVDGPSRAYGRQRNSQAPKRSWKVYSLQENPERDPRIQLTWQAATQFLKLVAGPRWSETKAFRDQPPISKCTVTEDNYFRPCGGRSHPDIQFADTQGWDQPGKFYPLPYNMGSLQYSSEVVSKSCFKSAIKLTSQFFIL